MASDKQKRYNWIKASLSLLYLKEGLAEELDDQAVKFHDHIEQLVAARCETAVTAPRCTNCTSKSIKRSKKLTSDGTFWCINCPNNVCNHWLDTFIQFHEHMPGPNVEWANCDPTLWASKPWEVAKVFQPVGCQQQRNAEESDVAGLLTLVLKCKFFHKLVSNTQILQEIKECRNKIMHSATLEVEEADMKNWLDLMISLLEDNKHLGKLSSCKSAAGRIRELRDKLIEISFDKDDENKALGLPIATLSAEVSNIQREYDDLRCRIRDLTSKHQSSSEESNHIRLKLSTSVTTISELKVQMETLQQTLRVSDVPHVKARLSDIQQRLQFLSKQNEEDTRSIFAKIGDIECKMDTMQHQLKSHEEQIGSLHKDSDKDVVGPLYQGFERCLLTEDKLMYFNYPRAVTPGSPCDIKLYGGQHGFTRGTCERCETRFDTTYAQPSGPCDFHTEPSRRFNRRQHPHGCCGKGLGSTGCRNAASHTHKENWHLDTTGFTRTDQAAENHGIYAMNTESIHTKKGLEVAKVSMVNTKCEVVYDEKCIPTEEIIDYNTIWSGLSASDFAGVTKTFAEVQQDLLVLISAKTILVGHGLGSDLMALKIVHDKAVDTLVLYPHPRGLPLRSSLKDLASKQLGKQIQVGDGHDSRVDADIAMKLALRKIGQ